MNQNVVRKRCLVRYEGHVQGVGFRFNAVRQTAGLSVHGYVRNEEDGSVLLDVEGTALDVNRLLKRIEAEMQDRIEAIQVDELPLTGATEGFKIRH